MCLSGRRFAQFSAKGAKYRVDPIRVVVSDAQIGCTVSTGGSRVSPSAAAAKMRVSYTGLVMSWMREAFTAALSVSVLWEL